MARQREKKKVRLKTNPLVSRMEIILEKILDSKQEDEDVRELVPDVDFLLNYLRDVIEFRLVLLGDKGLEPILEKIDINEAVGERLGFQAGILRAAARVIAKDTPTVERVAKWKKKLQGQ